MTEKELQIVKQLEDLFDRQFLTIYGEQKISDVNFHKQGMNLLYKLHFSRITFDYDELKKQQYY